MLYDPYRCEILQYCLAHAHRQIKHDTKEALRLPWQPGHLGVFTRTSVVR